MEERRECKREGERLVIFIESFQLSYQSSPNKTRQEKRDRALPYRN